MKLTMLIQIDHASGFMNENSLFSGRTLVYRHVERAGGEKMVKWDNFNANYARKALINREEM